VSDMIYIGGPCHGQIKPDFGLGRVDILDAQEITHPFHQEIVDAIAIKKITYERRFFYLVVDGAVTQRRMAYMCLESLSDPEAEAMIDALECEEFDKIVGRFLS